ncbi:MAG: hypothetical protein IPL53_14505 [Ignavibacteria bacterium]|nr:hypothetical protein [Ignavibacteria bacterium]
MNFIITNSSAAQSYSDVAGEYSLKGIPEMAAGFRFNEDSTFQFYYIYGAADRSAHGKYTLIDGRIILKSSKSAGNDFTLSKELKSGNGFTVSIADSNKLLIKDIVCFFISGTDTFLVQTNAEGIANAEIKECDKILIIHSFYPDIPTVINVKDEENNYFELTLNQSLAEVAFDDAVIEFDKENGETILLDNTYLFSKKVSFVKK